MSCSVLIHLFTAFLTFCLQNCSLFFEYFLMFCKLCLLSRPAKFGKKNLSIKGISLLGFDKLPEGIIFFPAVARRNKMKKAPDCTLKSDQNPTTSQSFACT